MAKMLLSIALIALSSSNVSAQIIGALRDIIDVSNNGPGSCTAAPNDGTSDASISFSCKLTALSTTGGILYVSPGTYRLDQTITIPSNVLIEGAGAKSILSQRHSFLGKLIVLNTRSQLRNLVITQEQPAPTSGWQPYLDYDYQVQIGGTAIDVDDITLLSPTKGFLVSPITPGGAVGQITMRNIKSQPLLVGIYIDQMYDLSRFEDIHFWPFWANDTNVKTWTREHAMAVQSYRADGPVFTNFFAFRYFIGMLFDSSSYGITSRPQITDFYCDFCHSGITIFGDGTNGVKVEKMTIVDDSPGTPSVHIVADSVSLAISKMDITNVNTNVVRIEGSYDSVLVSDSLIRSWNYMGPGFYAFDQASGTNSIISVSNTFYNNGYGGGVSHGNVVLNAVSYAPGL